MEHVGKLRMGWKRATLWHINAPEEHLQGTAQAASAERDLERGPWGGGAWEEHCLWKRTVRCTGRGGYLCVAEDVYNGDTQTAKHTALERLGRIP